MIVYDAWQPSKQEQELRRPGGRYRGRRGAWWVVLVATITVVGTPKQATQSSGSNHQPCRTEKSKVAISG